MRLATLKFDEVTFCALCCFRPSPEIKINLTFFFLNLITIEDSYCKLVSLPWLFQPQDHRGFSQADGIRENNREEQHSPTAWSQPGSHPRLFQLCNLWRLAPKAADQLIGGSNPEQSYTETSTWNRHWRFLFWSATGTLVRSVALCNVYPAYRSSAITTIKTVVTLFPLLIKRVSRFFSFEFHKKIKLHLWPTCKSNMEFWPK